MSYPRKQATLTVDKFPDTKMAAMLTGCPVGQELGCTVPVTEVKSLDGITFLLAILI